MKKKMNNRKKTYKRLRYNILFVLILLCVYGIATNVDFGKKVTKTNEVVVQQGDTLWNIANSICQKDDKLNIQNVVIEIREINELTSSQIYSGQVLNIPVY